VEDSARAALVTGGTGRVGRAIVARLQADGFRVKAAGRRDGDLSRAEGARSLVASAVAELGRLDLVVHAASEGFVPRPLEEVSEDDWDAALGATAKGAFFVAQAAVPHLRASGDGLLVLIEDVAAYEPWPLFAPHCAAKAAEAMLTRVLARTLAPEIRVCGVAPGTVTLDAGPGREERRAAETLLGRVGSPEDVAEAVAYLTRAGYVTGASLVVDGGRLLQRERGPQSTGP
jgi:NAD(P)-dependent dehydrogenase (short-subunit alcohol dehydrogenase family)